MSERFKLLLDLLKGTAIGFWVGGMVGWLLDRKIEGWFLAMLGAFYALLSLIAAWQADQLKKEAKK